MFQEVSHTAPSPFELLESRMVQDGVQLSFDQLIDLNQAAFDLFDQLFQCSAGIGTEPELEDVIQRPILVVERSNSKRFMHGIGKRTRERLTRALAVSIAARC